MTEKLRVIRKKLNDEGQKNRPRMTGAQLAIAAERITQEIEARAMLRMRGELSPEDDILEITEWI